MNNLFENYTQENINYDISEMINDHPDGNNN